MSGRSAAPPTEQQVQEDLVRLDAYRNQLSAMVQQYQYLSASKSDHVRARETLEGLERAKENPEVLVPLGGDAFVRGTPSPKSNVFLGVGSGVVVELDRGKVVELLTERTQRIDQAASDLEGQIRTLEERIQALSRRLEALSQGGAAAEELPVVDVGGD